MNNKVFRWVAYQFALIYVVLHCIVWAALSCIAENWGRTQKVLIETIIQNRGLAAHMLLQRLCYVDEGKETQKLTKVATCFSSLWKSLFNFKIVYPPSARNIHITFSNKMFNICRHGKVLFFVNSNKIWSSKARSFLLHTGWFFYWSLPIDKND